MGIFSTTLICSPTKAATDRGVYAATAADRGVYAATAADRGVYAAAVVDKISVE